MKYSLPTIAIGTMLAVASAAAVQGEVIVYDDRERFFNDFAEVQARFGQFDFELSFEDFNTGVALPRNDFGICAEPVDHRSNSICFRPGDLIEGFGITTSDGKGLVWAGNEYFDTPNRVIGAWPFQSHPPVTNVTQFHFDHGPTLIAADVYGAELSGGVPTGQTVPVEIEVLDQHGALIATATVESEAYNVPSFFGLISPRPIGRVHYSTPVPHSAEMIDNMYFGGGPGRLAAERDTVVFETIDIGAHTVESLTLANTGHLPLEVGTVPEPLPPFYLVADACSNERLGAGESCVIELRFAPEYQDLFSQVVEVPSNDASAPMALTLTARGRMPWPNL